MSGHNKWSQIKHKKAKEDAKKGLVFTKLIKEITLAARQGGGDPDLNPKLRLLLEKGRTVNMPIDNAQRAILRGTGELPGMQYEEQSYEGYGTHGVAIIVDTLTDNKTRTVAELRRIFLKNGGNLAENGVVSWMFDVLGVLQVKKQNGISEDTLLELLLDYEIQDIVSEDNEFIIYCAVKNLMAIKQTLESTYVKTSADKQEKIQVTSAEIEKIAKNTISLNEEDAEKVLALLSALQDHDDVQEVYTTLN
jgi:YebC/PmpR family DNA-binding regulatory protein